MRVFRHAKKKEERAGLVRIVHGGTLSLSHLLFFALSSQDFFFFFFTKKKKEAHGLANRLENPLLDR